MSSNLTPTAFEKIPSRGFFSLFYLFDQSGKTGFLASGVVLFYKSNFRSFVYFLVSEREKFHGFFRVFGDGELLDFLYDIGDAVAVANIVDVFPLACAEGFFC